MYLLRLCNHLYLFCFLPFVCKGYIPDICISDKNVFYWDVRNQWNHLMYIIFCFNVHLDKASLTNISHPVGVKFWKDSLVVSIVILSVCLHWFFLTFLQPFLLLCNLPVLKDYQQMPIDLLEVYSAAPAAILFVSLSNMNFLFAIRMHNRRGVNITCMI